MIFNNDIDSILADFGKITKRLNRLTDTEATKRDKLHSETQRLEASIAANEAAVEQSVQNSNRARRIASRIEDLSA